MSKKSIIIAATSFVGLVGGIILYRWYSNSVENDVVEKAPSDAIAPDNSCGAFKYATKRNNYDSCEETCCESAG